MANQIVNGAAMVIEQGTQDLSKRVLPREPEFIPQHLPKFFIFGQKGSLEPQLVVGAERDRIYGAETFNLRSKFANHATVFANSVNAQGNACMLQRLVPADIGPEATITVWLDVLPTTVDLYERNTDGSIKVDLQGDPITTTTTAGHKVKWVVSHYADKAALEDFGQQTIKPGDQTDVVSSTQSQRYPIFELKASSLGSVYNLSGIRLWAPTTKSVSTMPNKMMQAHRAYPYFMSVIRRPDALSAPKLVETLFAEQKMMVTFKRDTIDPLTDKELYVGDHFVDAYQNLTDLRYPKQFGEFGDMKVYDENIDTLLAMFHDKEKAHIDQYSDFSVAVTDMHLFNFVTGVTSSNTPYHTFQFVDSVNAVRFSEYTNVYAAGATDGTLTDAAFATLVKNEMEAYIDPNNFVQELAVNVESIMYDSGFPMETKMAMAAFIAQRKDTFVVLSTHDVNDRILTAVEEHSIAIALRSRLQSFPESDYFGTPVTRAMIIGRSGKLRNSQFTKDLPLSLEVAIKAAKYMGASNGRWTNGANFDSAPGSVVQYMTGINVTWVPAAVRNRNWDVGLNWVQAYDRKSYFFPALKTIYDDDTSVLNSFFTAMAICQLNKIAHAAWREFSGTSSLTNNQLATRVDDFINNRVANRFDDRFIIVPETKFTDMDLLRGFSWTLPIKIYAPNMKTVMTTYTQAFRKDDLEA